MAAARRAQPALAGTSFSSIPSNWRCPDCGTDKTTFRPQVETQRKQIVG
jgi:GntR family transcriptional regulator/MocR family aminotransferase